MIDLFKAIKRRKDTHIRKHSFLPAAPETNETARDAIHTSRESWLRAATDELRPYFARYGYILPEKIRFAIAFTSRGKRGLMAGECWHAESSGDRHYEIIIRADKDDPVEVLGILVHELVHSLLPPTVKHGKEFRDIAWRVGLEGPMLHTVPAPPLRRFLSALAAKLGKLPHAKLDYLAASEERRRKTGRYILAECSAPGCDYKIRLSRKWVKVALPFCPINPEHGRFVCKSKEENPKAD